MKMRAAMAPWVLALGLLAGCSSDDRGSGGRYEELAADNAEIKKKLDAFGESLRTLESRVHELDRENRALERMLSLAEQDLRSRLLEMVQQEMAGGGRRFAQRAFLPPAEPRPYLGLDAETNSAETAKKLGLPVETGVVVTKVTQGAPADVGGVQEGDVLQSIDETPVATRDALVELFGQIKPGQECRLHVLRGKKRMELKVKVGAR